MDNTDDLVEQIDEADLPPGWYTRLRALADDFPIAGAIADEWDANIGVKKAIIATVKDALLRMQAERSEERDVIVRRHQASHGTHRKVATSRNVLTARVRGSKSLELLWTNIFYQRVAPRDTNPPPLFRSIRMGKTGRVDLRLVAKGAHHDEIELLTQHEMEARYFRRLWKRATRVTVALDRFGKAYHQAMMDPGSIDDDKAG